MKTFTDLKEEAELNRIRQLAKLGLVDKPDVEKLIMTFKRMRAGQKLTVQQKDMLVQTFSDLASIVTGDTTMFMKMKKAVQKEAVVEEVKLTKEQEARKKEREKMEKTIKGHQDKMAMAKLNGEDTEAHRKTLNALHIMQDRARYQRKK